ncbi:UxaA family hydrolase [Caulobacter segnis]
MGDSDLAHTRKLIAALASHPNAGGVLLLGLGCENGQPTGAAGQRPRDRP